LGLRLAFAAIFYLMYICSHRFEGQGIDGKEIEIVFARACMHLRRGYPSGALLCGERLQGFQAAEVRSFVNPTVGGKEQ
jgi:hypothetical protein